MEWLKYLKPKNKRLTKLVQRRIRKIRERITAAPRMEAPIEERRKRIILKEMFCQRELHECLRTGASPRGRFKFPTDVLFYGHISDDDDDDDEEESEVESDECHGKLEGGA
ncbi:uncharacterized protein LOC130724509 [Lotus japonicus]|uniref:uncharacterized protein LOC130724509 n=1 Tax=Lotus japonicus TaxID=34305 RepID=UPI00258B74E5|nr:uncharacterized protein LOC130724509 [Lotus japonicus]